MSGTGLGKSLSKLYELYCENGGVVTTDSRAVRSLPGPVFFALKGENFDGNDYAVQAVTEGAVAAVVQGKLPKGVKAGSPESAKYFVVEDTLAALQELAAYHRDMLGLPVIALTGSNGKTTTKELIARVLRTKYRVACTQGNLNNHIGVPLTLLSVTEEDDVAIVEMGANHRGEIAALCEIAAPNIGLVTNVGRAHLEGFGGPEGVRKGKGELYDYLAAHGGTAIYSLEDPVLAEMVAERFDRDAAGSTVGYAVADFGISAAVSAGESDKLILSTDRGEVRTHMAGAYNVANVAAALAVGDYFGVALPQALEAVAAYEPDNNRSQVVVSADTGNTLFMDAYNANPSSMAAALDNFLGLPGAEKRVLILGDMRELGDFSTKEHRAIVERLAVVIPQAECYLVGPEFMKALPESYEGMRVFPTADALAEAFKRGDMVIRNSHVLVKGSRGMALEKLYAML